MTIAIRYQKRKSLALKITPAGLVALLPHGVEPDNEQVQAFLADAVATLPSSQSTHHVHEPEQIYTLVETWSKRLNVTVRRIQLRTMRYKWASISTAGTLTLANDLLTLPLDLVEYVVVHELLHLKFPDHRKGWQVSMGGYLKDWKERDRGLKAYGVRDLLINSEVFVID